MQSKTFLLGKIILLCLASVVKCQWEGSGSGDGDIFIVDEPEGSGIWPAGWPAGVTFGPKYNIVSKVFNGDDEDWDFSGDGDAPTGSSGDGDIPTLVPSKNTKCSVSNSYCWCVDAAGDEIPGTRQYTAELSYHIECDDPFFLVISATDKMRTESPPVHETTTRRRRLPSKKPPKFLGGFTKDQEKSTVRAIPATADGRSGVDVERETVLPLFTHPGILAAVIGGGVVALLCALLLVMFIVYRMRKKDEGSYPLDPDAKPPRLHTYTRAPNKEFYA